MRVVLVSASVALVALLGGSCTRSSGSDGPSREPSAPPSSIAAEGGDLDDALVAAGVDTGRALALMSELDDRTFCGSDVRDHDPAELSAAARCFVDLHIAELDAVYVTTSPTVEGDPITSVYVTGRDGVVSVFTDTTRDSYGSDGWYRSDARRVAVSRSFGLDRIDLVDSAEAELDAPLPDHVDEDPPTWLLDRTPLRWCGVEVRTEDQNMEARQCLRDAVASGDPAELVVGQTGDEGERGIHWFRVLGPDAFEVIERTLPGVGPAAGGPPAWRRLRCPGIEFMYEPGAQADQLPLADDQNRCTEQ
ncbi:MAG: hypothetical protein ACK4V6_07000 [Microthrixaceae bacterium]